MQLAPQIRDLKIVKIPAGQEVEVVAVHEVKTEAQMQHLDLSYPEAFRSHRQSRGPLPRLGCIW